jgi:hypothetical protein
MDGPYNMHDREYKCIQGFDGMTRKKEITLKT